MIRASSALSAMALSSGDRHAAFGQFRLIDSKAEAGRVRQAKQSIDRKRWVLEHRVGTRRRIVPLTRFGRADLAGRDMEARHVADRRLRLVRHKLCAVRVT